MVFFGAITLLSIIVWDFSRSFSRPAKVPPAFTPVKEYEPTPEIPSRDTSTDLATKPAYKLLVGANPTVSKTQTFAPPKESVAVTNEAHLRLLMEQAKNSRQQTANK